MNSANSQAIGALAIGLGLLYAMVWLAARMSMLDLPRPEKCPSCGKLRTGKTCSCSR